MSEANPTGVVVAVAVVCLLSVALGGFGLRLSRTTSDFYVASRGVSTRANAWAIGGEYLSAASFLGVAGLVYLQGLDALWFPVGYTIGFVVLLVFVAAPLRRSGAYTLPDFAQIRLNDQRLRGLCTALVAVIGWLYLLPQLQGAGLAIQALTGAPTWVGGLLVTVVVTANVLAGGMRSLTVVQAMHFWIKLVAISVPAVVLVWWWFRHGQPLAPPHPGAPGAIGTPVSPGPLAPPGSTLGPLTAPDDGGWQAIYRTYSNLLALCLGTMGLPHVVVRFYTNPDGRGARRTTVTVVGLLGAFYVFPPLFGVLGRLYVPHLPDAGLPDSVTLLVPSAMAPGTVGDILTALLAAGAFAAFLSTASGLALSVAGVLDQAVVRPGLMRLTGGDTDGISSFRIATLFAMAIPAWLMLGVSGIGLASTVSLAFALTASTFCPLLVLGVWWRRLTPAGIGAGMSVGGVLAGSATLVTVTGLTTPGWSEALLAHPAAWSVPSAFAVAVIVSWLTPGQVPRDVLRTMVRLHTPETVKLDHTRR